jgi:AraC family transcriptional regulator
MLMELTRSSAQSPEHSVPIIHSEQTWLARRSDDRIGIPATRVSASRWTGYAGEPREEASTIGVDRHVLGIALRSMDLTFFAAEKLLFQGRMQQGMLRVAEPGQTVRAIFHGNFDALHLHVPNAMITECLEAGAAGSSKPVNLLGSQQPTHDPVIERLASALVRAEDFGGAFGQSYADGVSLAIVARLLGKVCDERTSPGGTRISGLPKWRLKRAIDYMAAHLSDSISLADIAASAGLTRMHFAAQFRASTGLRPHEYLLRRRIEQAQDLLARSRLPLVEIAFEVGFKTQAHFSTVFSRLVGETPYAWRQQACAAA